MYSRKQYVEICKTCQRRQFDMNKGILCSLTGDYASFEGECPDRKVDEVAWNDQQRVLEAEREEQMAGQTLGMSRVGIKNKTAAGIILMILGFGWLIGGLSLGWIFYYPIFLIIGGLVVMLSGLAEGAKKAQEIQKPDTSDILDNEFE